MNEQERIEALAEVLIRHQRIPLYNSGPGRNRCVGCDNLHGETDGSNSPRHAEHLARAILDSPAMRALLAEAWEEGHDTCCAVYARHCSYAVNPHHEETP